MIDTIEQKLCELARIKKSYSAGRTPEEERTASRDGFTLKRYTGAFWEGLEATCNKADYLEFDATHDGDAGQLEISIGTPQVIKFKQAVASLTDEGKLYDRLREGCGKRIEALDKTPEYSQLTLVINPGEEAQAAKIIYSILTYKIKSDRIPARPKKKLSRAEILALKFAEKSGLSSED